MADQCRLHAERRRRLDVPKLFVGGHESHVVGRHFPDIADLQVGGGVRLEHPNRLHRHDAVEQQRPLGEHLLLKVERGVAARHDDVAFSAKRRDAFRRVRERL